MIRQYKDWMRDNWNHPSVAVWDANNETKDAMFGDKIIPAVRPLTSRTARGRTATTRRPARTTRSKIIRT